MLKAAIYLVIFAIIALVAYAYLAPLDPQQSQITIPVDLNAN
jgi:hypothetical protein